MAWPWRSKSSEEPRLFVGGLPPDTTNLEMYQIFSAFGPIAPRGATALLDKDNGKCTGIGFINYMNAEAAEKAASFGHLKIWSYDVLWDESRGHPSSE